jgi:hypothetical protein
VPRALRVCLVLSVLAAVAAVGFFLIRQFRHVPQASPAVVGHSQPQPTSKTKACPEAAILKLAADESAEYAERVKAVGTLGVKLDAGAVAEAVTIIQAPGVHTTIRNDLVSKLESQARRVGTLGPLLIDMWRDSGQNATWRNYCLQHMAPAWQLEPAHRKDIEAELFGAVSAKAGEKENDASRNERLVASATAMLSLARIGESDAGVAGKVKEAALSKLSAWKEDPAGATAAMQIAAASGEKSALPAARKLAADDKAPVSLRMAALAALGRLGGKGDEAVLVAMASSRDSRLKQAGELNLAALKKRLGPTAEGTR